MEVVELRLARGPKRWWGISLSHETGSGERSVTSRISLKFINIGGISGTMQVVSPG